MSADKPVSYFEGYLELQKESYEFISRSMAMHNWLQEAYELFQEQPRLGVRSLYQAWEPIFDKLYEELFSFLLRPYRESIQSLKEIIQPSWNSNLAQTPMGGGMSFLQSFNEGQAQFMNGFFSGFESGRSDAKNVNNGSKSDPFIDYLESLGRPGNSESERSEFPRPMVLQLEKICSGYREFCSLTEKHQSMFQQAWAKSIRNFVSTLKKSRESREIEYEIFFETYVGILAEHYDRLMRRREFLTVQNQLTNLSSNLTDSARKVVAMRFEKFSLLPFSTKSEMESMADTVHNLRRKIAELENKLMDMEDNLEDKVTQEPSVQLQVSKSKLRNNVGRN